jgi:hypothetical protein
MMTSWRSLLAYDDLNMMTSWHMMTSSSSCYLLAYDDLLAIIAYNKTRALAQMLYDCFLAGVKCCRFYTAVLLLQSRRHGGAVESITAGRHCNAQSCHEHATAKHIKHRPAAMSTLKPAK